MKTINKFCALALLTVSLPSMAALSGDVGLTTDYVFRGQSQTNEDAAIQGGVDWNEVAQMVFTPESGAPQSAKEIHWLASARYPVSQNLCNSYCTYQ